jgi:predicted transcriptional regulator
VDRHGARAEATEPRRIRPFAGLQAAIIEPLWDAERPVLVRDVLNDLHPQRLLAYTTVMTVKDNLYRKGWLTRER